MDRHKLDGLTREELVALASELGIVRPRLLTVPELIDEIISRTASSEREKARSRGWFGRARSLLASVIERGLHLPDVVKALRNAPSSRSWPTAPTPLATMTLAEIYAAQGHLDKALHVLDEILAREPEHADARSLRQRLDAQSAAKKRPDAPSKREDVLTPNESKSVVETNVAPVEEPAVIVSAPEAPAAPTVDDAAAVVADAAVEIVSANIAQLPVESMGVAEQASSALDTLSSAPEEPSLSSDELEAVEQEQAPAQASASDTEAPSDEDELVAADSLEDQASAPFDSYDRPSIEELPLPERYNVDEIVGIAVDPTTVYLYWEVRPIVLARAHARRSDGTMIVRLVAVTPTWDGPIVEQRDVPIDALYGDAYVRNLRPGSNVRIGVGWLEHGDFAPFAIGDPVTTPRKEAAFAVASAVARFTPQGTLDVLVPGQTAETALLSSFHVAPSPMEAPAMSLPAFIERELLGTNWPTFDLGQRGLPAAELERVPRTTLGGASELPPGGASDLVRPIEQRVG